MSEKSAVQINMAYIHDQEHSESGKLKGNSGNQRVTYTWENIEVEANIAEGSCFSRMCKKSKTSQKRILNNVSGVVQPGEFLAIMGASGAGKTTLLNCLTFRNTGKLKIAGQRRINGVPVDKDSLARVSAYVQQDDLFIGTLNVKEHLRFQALLRMDKHLTYRERMDRVDEVMQELGLSKCADTIIGDPARGTKGISGGERKRLAFASEVLTNPPLMFCDEPTSGLDSYMAQNIVQVLKNLAATGKAVICTIHQPSSEVFALFDRILLMAEGRSAFLGPIDQALHFFSAQGLPCPSNYNPADFYIYSLATVPGQESESRERIRGICDAYESSNYGSQVRALVQSNNTPESNGTSTLVSLKRSRSPYKASWFDQFSAVLWRSWISQIKDPRVTYVKASSALFLGILVAIIYQGQSVEEFSDIEGFVQNIQGVLFLFITNATFQNVYGVVSTFAGEVPIFLREHFNGMYRTDVYFLSKMLAEFPLYIIFPMVSFAIPYYVVGLNPGVDRFFIGSAIIVLVTNVAVSFGYFVSCLASNTEMASALGAPLILPSLLFGGFFLNNGLVPVYLDWLRYLSWFMYSNEALSINQWRGLVITDSNNNSTLLEGNFVLERFSFNEDYLLRDIFCLIALIVGFRLLAFLSLLGKTYRKA